MTKQEFIYTLYKKLKNFPTKEVEERISFYSEIIDDNIEDGLTEEEAVAKIGNIDEIVDQIAGDIPLAKIVKTNAKPKRRLSGVELTLIIVSSPIWISVIAVLFAVVVSVVASLFAVVISFWGVAVGFIVGGPIAAILGVVFIFVKSTAEGLAMLGSGLVLAGVGIFILMISKTLTKLLIKFTKVTVLAIKKAFVSKEVQ